MSDLDLEQLLIDLSQKGVRLSLDGENLSIRAPKGVLTSDIQRRLSQSKSDIINWLRQNHQNPSQLIIKPALRDNVIPLSFGQERLWNLISKDPASTVYNLPAFFLVGGPLNQKLLEKSVVNIIERHENLRTFISVDKGHPEQIISAKLDWTLQLVDLSEVSNQEKEANLESLLDEWTSTPFKLEQLPLFRINLIKTAEQEYILAFVFHHFIFDGWSINIFFQELKTLYKAFSQETKPPLAELPIQYADYSVWQRQFLQGEQLQKQLKFWEDQLGPGLETLHLPVDHSSSLGISYEGDFCVYNISKDLTQSLKDLSQKEGVTLFTTLLTAFKALLYCYTNQEDLLVSTPVSCRNQPGLEGIIGYFNNLLPLRTHVSGTMSIRDLLEQISKRTLGIYKYQELPFQMLADLPEARRVSLTRGVFIFLSEWLSPLEAPELTVTTLKPIRESSNFELCLSLTEQHEIISATIQYKSSLFEKSTIEQFFLRYEKLLLQMAEDLETSLSTLQKHLELPRPISLLTEKQKKESSDAYAAPRNDLEEQLVSILEEELNVKRIGVRDNFFDLGLNSLVAIKLIERIQSQFGYQLTLSSINTATSVEGLASLILYGEDGKLLMPIQTSGSQTPLFMATPGGNNAFVYSFLVKELGPDIPFYAVKFSRDSIGHLNSFPKLEDIAAQAITEIRSVQPKGPYNLGGYCAGAVLAYEIARQLSLSEEVVNQLIVIDVHAERPPLKRVLSLINIRWRLSKSGFQYQASPGLSDNIFARMLDYLHQYRQFYKNVIVPFNRAIQLNRQYRRTYIMKPYMGRVLLVLAKDEGGVEDMLPAGGWDKYAHGGVSTTVLPGNHISIIYPPYTQHLAEYIKTSIYTQVHT